MNEYKGGQIQECPHTRVSGYKGEGIQGGRQTHPRGLADVAVLADVLLLPGLLRRLLDGRLQLPLPPLFSFLSGRDIQESNTFKKEIKRTFLKSPIASGFKI